MKNQANRYSISIKPFAITAYWRYNEVIEKDGGKYADD